MLWNAVMMLAAAKAPKAPVGSLDWGSISKFLNWNANVTPFAGLGALFSEIISLALGIALIVGGVLTLAWGLVQWGFSHLNDNSAMRAAGTHKILWALLFFTVAAFLHQILAIFFGIIQILGSIKVG